MSEEIKIGDSVVITKVGSRYSLYTTAEEMFGLLTPTRDTIVARGDIGDVRQSLRLESSRGEVVIYLIEIKGQLVLMNADGISKVKQMTQREIEAELGYPIEITNLL